MITFVLLSLPIFGVAVGWAAARLRIVQAAALDALGAFSFRFGLPALVLPLIANQPIQEAFDPAFFAGYLASGGLVFGSALGVALTMARQPLPAAGAQATTATVSNLGFLGLPLMLASFGERAAGPLAMAILAEVMILLSIGGVLMSTAGGERVGIGRLVLGSTIRNPVVVAIAIGAVIAATGLALPVSVERFLAFLGGAAGPTALFALGGALALQRLDRATLRAASAITAAKLLLYPVVAWCVLELLLGLEPIWVQAGVLLAALPSAGNIYVMAQRYRSDPDRVSAAIALSTLVSVLVGAIDRVAGAWPAVSPVAVGQMRLPRSGGRSSRTAAPRRGPSRTVGDDHCDWRGCRGQRDARSASGRDDRTAAHRREGRAHTSPADLPARRGSSPTTRQPTGRAASVADHGIFPWSVPWCARMSGSRAEPRLGAMNSYDITTALAVERTNTLLTEAANARLVKAAQRSAGTPAATHGAARWNPFRRGRAAVA